jgi:hypothetical protein
MSILPELVIQRALVMGINRFREDGDLVAMLFRNLNQVDVDGIRQFIRNESVDIALSWPDSIVKLPSIVISLKNENEDQAFLGDLMQSVTNIQHTGTPFRKEKLVAPATLLGSGSIGTTGDPTVPLETPYQATRSTANSVFFSMEPPFNISDPFEFSSDEELLIVIREGMGAGQRRAVSAIIPRAVSDEVEVQVTSNWATAPNATSVVQFYLESNRVVIGEPTKLFEPDEHIERLGSLYRTSYQILIAGPNQEITLFLYAMVKAIFIVNREFLQRHGFIEPKLGGTDFVAKPEYLPELAYHRALILEFQNSFDVYLTPEIITGINLSLEVFDPDVSDSSGVGRVVSETTLDLS